MKYFIVFTASAALLTVIALTASPAPATSFENLSKLAIPNTTVTLAQTVAAGAFTAPAGGRGAQSFSDLPSLCRVQATLKPSSDSDIKMELWMPAAANWNGKFRGTGNG